MPTYATGVQIIVGDWVYVLVPSKGVWHHGIVRRICWVGTGFAVEVANNRKDLGVVLSDWQDFAEGQMIYLRHRASSPTHVQEILARIDSNLGKPYDLFARNCEHFASFAFTGVAESESVRSLGWIGAALVVIAFLR